MNVINATLGPWNSYSDRNVIYVDKTTIHFTLNMYRSSLSERLYALAFFGWKNLCLLLQKFTYSVFAPPNPPPAKLSVFFWSIKILRAFRLWNRLCLVLWLIIRLLWWYYARNASNITYHKDFSGYFTNSFGWEISCSVHNFLGRSFILRA